MGRKENGESRRARAPAEALTLTKLQRVGKAGASALSRQRRCRITLSVRSTAASTYLPTASTSTLTIRRQRFEQQLEVLAV